jgi:hypothetical protein
MNWKKAFITLTSRFASGNSVPVDRATITRTEFDLLMGEVNRLQVLCHIQFEELGRYHQQLHERPKRCNHNVEVRHHPV